MRHYGHARLFALVAAVVLGVLVLGGTAISWAVTNCQKPNENEKLCRSVPADIVTDCTAQPSGSCQGKSQYSILPFPDGAKPSPSGLTTETLADCWKENRCKLDYSSVSDGKCVAVGWSNYYPAAKTIVKPNAACPTEE